MVDEEKPNSPKVMLSTSGYVFYMVDVVNNLAKSADVNISSLTIRYIVTQGGPNVCIAARKPLLWRGKVSN